MKGRRGRPHSSSSSSDAPAAEVRIKFEVSQGQNRMALRKQMQKDVSDIPSVSQIEEDAQEDDAPDDKDELSLSMLTTSTARGKRRRERANKSKSKEMTEEEMMDLALRLSEREASMTALKLREEEEDMMKAIQESMVSQTQLYPPSQSQSILGDADAPICVSSRRKLLYPNGKKPFDGDQVASETDYTLGEEKSRGPKEGEDEPKNMNKIQKRLDGSPLMEMPDSNICSQASPSSGSESLRVPLDSPQSSDSTQIEDCQLRKSPVFPMATSRAQVCISPLSQDVLENCAASGFVSCSQYSCTQKSLPARPQSPTFPKSPACVNNVLLPETAPSLKHGTLSGTDQGDDAETQLSPQYCKSPVFGRNAQSEDPQSALKAESRGCENSGFISLSQECLTSTSCQPRSPVFNKDITVCKSPDFSETDQRQDTVQNRSCSKSPVFGRTGQKQNTASLTAELRDPNSGGNPTSCSSRGSEHLRQDIDLDTSDEDRCNYIMVSPRPDDNEEELTEAWNSMERELTSDMTLHWSDEDADVIPVDSPSPVFPEERAVHQAGAQTASQKLPTAASPQTNCSLNPQKCHSASFTNNKSNSIRQTSPGPPSSASTCQQHRSAVDPAPSAEPLTGQTVHYYWGVPFCPRGLDPDSYTKVILAQMEVYEKSVKQAQRCLMKKAEWGEPILPQPEKSPSPESASESPQLHLPRRRVLRQRGNNPCEDTETPTAEAEEEEDDKKEEDREEKKEEEEEGKGGEQQPDSDDCTVCPETQLSDNDSTQDLMMDTDAAAELRVKSPELPEVQEILQDEAPTMDKQHQEDDEEMDVDVETEDPEDRETNRNKPICDAAEGQTVRPEDRTDPDVEVVQDRGSLQRSKSPELEPAAVPQSPESSVDCPICQRSFPVSEIEMHAAYCDGDVAVVDEVSLKPRRKRARRTEVAPEETNHTSITGKSGLKQEKCYVCQKAVPLRDYSRHTELCIHRSGSKMATTGSLLSALDRTESRDSEAGPSGSRVHPGEIIDLRNEEEEEDSVTAIRVSNSPIRSFTPISEVSDCLIDFRKQHRVKKPSQRRR
ncbi:BRCA1-A complex subunit RAP80 isoform X2 [Sphaeramia orbicularis]|uniref:BRCA1-A complex subunit RAP80 isoform X2 n=1 Tax=Sphaeramia orbicularis TaxID=375764 RepID=UPI00117FEACD|nr:BRCA1-A complex subunit RAP80 isoform X2 [Sphaeramia orbicularis]